MEKSALLIILALCPAHVDAEAIRVAFHNGQTTVNAMTGRPAGLIVKTGQDAWNNVANNGGVGLSTSNVVLLDLTGTDSGARLAATSGFSTYNNNDWGSGTQDHVMMEGWYGFRATESITVTNLPAHYAAGFTVTVCGDSNSTNRLMNYTIGGESRSIQDSGTFSGDFTAGANFTTFGGLTGTSFTLTGNPGATDARSAVNALVITPGTLPEPPVIEIFAADNHYLSPGGTATLSWQSSGAGSLSITPDIGTVAGPGGSLAVSPSATTTYTLTATNADGATNATVRIGVGPPRPNIVFFFVDDMGWQDTSVPFHYDSSGHPIITPLNERYRTPGMETLANRGMKFTRAYAHPVCTPSRVTWVTGKNPARHRVSFWTNPAGTETGGTAAVPHLRSPTDWRRTGIAATEIPLPQLLADAGYRTIHAGKGHFGSQGAFGQYPENLGFDVNIAGNEIGHPGSYSGNYGQSSNRPVPGLQEYHHTGTHLSEALTLEINKAIEKAVGESAPFFAYMSHYAVHTPFETDPRFSANYPGLTGSSLAYATLLEGMDKSLGDMIAKLEQLGVAENTLIVFLSDNGGDAPGANGNAPLRGKKAMRYEGGMRVPMIAAWAKRDGENPFQTAIPIPAASRQDDLVSIADLFPTFLSVAGLGLEQDIDGHDLVPYLKAQPGSHRPQSLVTHFPHSHNNSFYSTYHQGDWKLIFNYGDESYELYNLAADIGENNNLAAAEPGRVTNMARAMALELNAMGAQYPQNLNTASPQPPPLPAAPHDPENSFRATPLEQDGRFVLRWPSQPGAVYRIETSPDLVGAWSVVAESVFFSGEIAEFDVGPVNGRSFFRVVWR